MTRVAVLVLGAAILELLGVPGAVADPTPVPTPIGVGPLFHPEPTSPAVADGRVVGALACRKEDASRWGAHLELFARGRVMIVPAGIGMAPPLRRRGAYVLTGRCSYAARTREPTGVIEIDASRPRDTRRLLRRLGEAAELAPAGRLHGCSRRRRSARTSTGAAGAAISAPSRCAGTPRSSSSSAPSSARTRPTASRKDSDDPPSLPSSARTRPRGAGGRRPAACPLRLRILVLRAGDADDRTRQDVRAGRLPAVRADPAGRADEAGVHDPAAVRRAADGVPAWAGAAHRRSRDRRSGRPRRTIIHRHPPISRQRPDQRDDHASRRRAATASSSTSTRSSQARSGTSSSSAGSRSPAPHHAKPLPPFDPTVTVDGYRFTLARAAQAAGDLSRPSSPSRCCGPNGEPAEFTPWYGALAHAIFFRAGSLDYFHTHVCSPGASGCTSILGGSKVTGTSTAPRPADRRRARPGAAARGGCSCSARSTGTCSRLRSRLKVA